MDAESKPDQEPAGAQAGEHGPEGTMLEPQARGSEAHPTLRYAFTRHDGVHVDTWLEAGRAYITHASPAGDRLDLLERSEFTQAERAMLRDITATA